LRSSRRGLLDKTRVTDAGHRARRRDMRNIESRAHSLPGASVRHRPEPVQGSAHPWAPNSRPIRGPDFPWTEPGRCRQWKLRLWKGMRRNEWRPNSVTDGGRRRRARKRDWPSSQEPDWRRRLRSCMKNNRARSIERSTRARVHRNAAPAWQGRYASAVSQKRVGAAFTAASQESVRRPSRLRRRPTHWTRSGTDGFLGRRCARGLGTEACRSARP
jgi:hypothetical protein